MNIIFIVTVSNKYIIYCFVTDIIVADLFEILLSDIMH
jgi:hypothetical protein